MSNVPGATPAIALPARLAQLDALLRLRRWEDADALGVDIEAAGTTGVGFTAGTYADFRLAWAAARRRRDDLPGSHDVLFHAHGQIDLVRDLRVAAARIELRVACGQREWLADDRQMEWQLLSDTVERENWQTPVDLSPAEAIAVRYLCSVRGEAEFLVGRRWAAKQWLARVTEGYDEVGTRTALFLGAIARDDHDAEEAVRQFDRAAESTDAEVARRAGEEAEPLRPAARRQRHVRLEGERIEEERKAEERRREAEEYAQWMAILEYQRRRDLDRERDG